MFSQNRRIDFRDIPGRVTGKLLNNYEADWHLVLSASAFQAQLNSSVLKHGSTKIVWNGVDRLEKGTIAVIHLNDPTFSILLVQLGKRRCEVQLPKAANGDTK